MAGEGEEGNTSGCGVVGKHRGKSVTVGGPEGKSATAGVLEVKEIGAGNCGCGLGSPHDSGPAVPLRNTAYSEIKE